jgi:hypothetical protein
VGEFSAERAMARLAALPPPPTLPHPTDAERQLYLRTLAHADTTASVRSCTRRDARVQAYEEPGGAWSRCAVRAPC